jgi:hypothetical protein
MCLQFGQQQPFLYLRHDLVAQIPRLTLGTYTHVELADQTNAIAALPGPPSTATMLVAGA